MSQSITDRLVSIAETIDGYCTEVAAMHVNVKVDYHTEGLEPFADEIATASVNAGRAAYIVGQSKIASSDATSLIKMARFDYQQLMDEIIDKFRVKYSSASWDDQAAGYRRQFDAAHGYDPTLELRDAESIYDRIVATVGAIIEMCNNHVYKSRIDIQAMVNILSPGFRGEY